LKRVVKLNLQPGTSWRGVLIAQSVAFLGCVIVPVMVTLMAPVTVLEYRKTGTEAQVLIVRYVLLFVPWRTQEIAGVTEIRADVTERKVLKDTKENRRKDQVGHVQLATGQVAVLGAGPPAIVQAQPGLAEDIAAEFAAFAASPEQGPVHRTVYASWALTYVLGGAMTALFALYVVGVTLAGLNAVRKLFG
jgi:hypothetical protein